MKKGIMFMIIACFFYACVDALVKGMSKEFPPSELVVLRYLTGLFATFPLWFYYKRPSLKTSFGKVHLLRAISGTACTYCFTYGVAHLQLSSAVLLKVTAPLFLPLIALLWLKEPIPRKSVIGLLFGFSGVTLIVKPGNDLFQMAALIAVGAGFFSALGQVCVRKTVHSESVFHLLLYLNVFSLLLSFFGFSGEFRMPQTSHLGQLLLLGFCGVCAQITITKAYFYTSAAIVAPFIFTYLPISLLLQWAVWGSLPPSYFYLGALGVIFGGIIVLNQRKQKQIKEAA